jgi:hypothetical protein
VQLGLLTLLSAWPGDWHTSGAVGSFGLAECSAWCLAVERCSGACCACGCVCVVGGGVCVCCVCVCGCLCVGVLCVLCVLCVCCGCVVCACVCGCVCVWASLCARPPVLWLSSGAGWSVDLAVCLAELQLGHLTLLCVWHGRPLPLGQGLWSWVLGHL